MSVSNSSGNTSVTGTVQSTAKIARPNAVGYGLSNNNTVTVYTCPASHTATIIGYTMNVIGYATTGATATLTAKSMIVEKTGSDTVITYGNTALTIGKVFPYEQAIQLAAGETVTVTTSTAGVNAWATVLIFEEDV